MSVDKLESIIESEVIKSHGFLKFLPGDCRYIAQAIHDAGYLRLEEVEVDYAYLSRIYPPEDNGMSSKEIAEQAEAHRAEWLKRKEA